MKRLTSLSVTLFLLAQPTFCPATQPINSDLRRRLGEAELSMRFEGNSPEEAKRWQQQFRARLNELLGPTSPPERWETVVESRIQLADHRSPSATEWTATSTNRTRVLSRSFA